MEILNSPWLIKMLEKSSKTPRGRLLNLFDILDDWLEAPNVVAPNVSEQLKKGLKSQAPEKILLDFLALEAAKAKAAAKKAADVVRTEADKQAAQLMTEAGNNPIKKKAAEIAGKKLKDEAGKKATKIEQEGNEKADGIMKKAQEQADRVGN